MTEDHNSDEVETFLECSPPRVHFVIVFPSYRKEVSLESDHTKKLLKDQEQNLQKEEEETNKIPKEILQQEGARSKSSYSPRRFFTDGWNSLWHFVFGVLAIKFKLLVPLFIFYQCFDIFEENIFIDIWEFLIGYVFGYVFYMI
jgi:hypothetical protein